MLVVLLVLPVANASTPQQHKDYPQGVSSISPGSDLWREVRQRDLPVSGITQVQGVESGVLINADGDRWARFRIENPVRYAPIVLLVVVAILVLFYALRGKVGIEGGLSGRMVKRFTDYERVVHWTLALVFLFLALTGLILSARAHAADTVVRSPGVFPAGVGEQGKPQPVRPDIPGFADHDGGQLRAP